MKKNLLIVTAIFPPVATSGIHRLVRITRYLDERDVDVFVLTVDEKTIAKGFKYDHEMMKKIPDNVRILRVPAFQGLKKLIELKNHTVSKNPTARSEQKEFSDSANSSRQKGASRTKPFKKIKDAITLNLNTPDNYAFWIRPAIKAGASLIREHQIQNILSSSPPGSSHVVAHHLKKKTGVRWIADFRDPWSRKHWFNPEMTSFKKRMIKRFERNTILNSDTVILNTQELKEDYGRYYGEFLQKKSLVIPNGFDPEDFKVDPVELPGKDDQIIISHVGTFYRHRSPLPFLEALGRAIRDKMIPPRKFKVLFIGGVGHFKPDVENLIQKYDLNTSVEIIPPVPHREAIQYMLASDLLLIVQPGTTVQIPAKIYEYIATEKPILAISARGATSNLVEKYHLGWWAQPESVDSISLKLKEIYRYYSSDKKWTIQNETLNQFNGKKLVDLIYDLL